MNLIDTINPNDTRMNTQKLRWRAALFAFTGELVLYAKGLPSKVHDTIAYVSELYLTQFQVDGVALRLMEFLMATKDFKMISQTSEPFTEFYRAEETKLRQIAIKTANLLVTPIVGRFVRDRFDAERMLLIAIQEFYHERVGQAFMSAFDLAYALADASIEIERKKLFGVEWEIYV